MLVFYSHTWILDKVYYLIWVEYDLQLTMNVAGPEKPALLTCKILPQFNCYICNNSTWCSNKNSNT